MKTKHLLLCFAALFFAQLTWSQILKPADPALRQKLQKYVTDNHLPPGGMYMFWDSATKKPVRFNPQNFMVEDATLPPITSSSVLPSSASTGTNNVLGGAANFHLVKDVNTSTDANPYNYSYYSYSNTSQYAVLNNVAYFGADDGVHGNELWRSDGTAAGTYLVKDILSGQTSTSPYNIFASATKLYFSFYNSTNLDYEVWTSDGTAAGTTPLLPVGTFLYGGAGNFCELNGLVYFTGSKGNPSDQLWKTDGTTAGTTLVKNYYSTDTYNLSKLTAANGLLFYTAYAGATGDELYRSDGTATGSYLVQDIFPSNYYYYTGPSQLTAYDGKLYFAADDGSGSKLWVTDGVSGGATYAAGYNNVALNGNVYFYYTNTPFTISNNVMYFDGYTPATGWELYKYDAASTEGVVLVKDITPGVGGYTIPFYSIAEVNGTVFFTYTDATGNHLYTTTGTSATTVDIKDFSTTAGIDGLYSANGKLYFNAFTTTAGAEPWTSDGTTAGTALVADIYPGAVGSNPYFFTPCNGKILFRASDNVHGNELFALTGSSTQLVKDINTTTTSGSYQNNVIAYQNGILAGAYTYDKGYELWKADKTDETLVSDIIPGQPGSYPGNFQVKNNLVYFIGYSTNGYYNSSLYKTDGTAAGTISLPLDSNRNISDFVVTDNGTVFYYDDYYNYNTQIGKYELWKTDGTPGGNVLLGTFNYISSTYNNYANKGLSAIGDTVYFFASDSSNSTTGVELHKSDGTVAGTGIVKDINPGNGNNYENQVIVFNNQLYFSAYDGTENALWKSDGTEAGTIKIASVIPSNFAISNNTLFFSGYNSIAGYELWKTDGTVEGTVLVKDIIAGSNGSDPANLTDVDGTLFFTVNGSDGNAQLWKTDGTSTGTLLVNTFYGISNSYYLNNFTAATDRLFFTLNNKLWTSDGTTAGTGLVVDDVASGLTVYNMVANGSQLYLNAYSYQYGEELYEGDASLAVLPVSLLSFTAALKNADVIAQWQTSSETNTSYFNVQRSTDGVHFTDAGKVAAKGNSNTLQQYSFPDANIANLVSAKTLYYRLQTVDKDGSTSFSKVVPVDLKWKDVVVLLHPNPVKDVLKIKINNYAGKATIDLYDLSGKKLYVADKIIQSGSDISINISALQAGVYVVKMNLNGKVIQQKFVKE